MRYVQKGEYHRHAASLLRRGLTEHTGRQAPGALAKVRNSAVGEYPCRVARRLAY